MIKNPEERKCGTFSLEFGIRAFLFATGCTCGRGGKKFSTKESDKYDIFRSGLNSSPLPPLLFPNPSLRTAGFCVAPEKKVGIQSIFFKKRVNCISRTEPETCESDFKSCLSRTQKMRMFFVSCVSCGRDVNMGNYVTRVAKYFPSFFASFSSPFLQQRIFHNSAGRKTKCHYRRRGKKVRR